MRKVKNGKSHVFRTSKRFFAYGCVLLIALLYSVLAGCGSVPLQEPSKPVQILRIHGSNLLPELAEAFLKQKKEAHRTNRIEIDVNHFRIEGVFPGDRTLQEITIRIMNSTTALQHLAEGKCDLAMTVRPIKDAELKAFSPRLQNLRSPHSEHIVALDGIAVVVNRENPLTRLTLKQLAGIFSGEIRDWAQVGGPQQPITIYAPAEDGGMSEAFRHIVLKDKPYPTSIRRVQLDVALPKSVADDINGIGFVKFKYAHQVKTLAISDGNSPFVRPDEFLVRTENYPLSHRLYLYMPEKSANPIAREFARFALSYEGQTVVALNNLVAQSLELVQPPGGAGPFKQTRKLKDYLILRQKGEQLPVNLRFHLDSSVPDNKAWQDIDRIVEFLTHFEALRTHTVLLVGFAHNEALSKQRAQAIKHILEERITTSIEIMELGDALRVANNRTKAGHAQNRRVEVWLLPSADMQPSPVVILTPTPKPELTPVPKGRDWNSGLNKNPKGATVLKLNSKKPEKGFLNAKKGDHTDWYKLQISTEGDLTYILKQQKGNATLIVRFYDVVHNMQELVEEQWIKDISLTGKSRQTYSIAGAKPGTYYAQVIVRNPGERSNHLITTAFVSKTTGLRNVDPPDSEPPQPTPKPTAAPNVPEKKEKIPLPLDEEAPVHGELLPPEIEITSHPISSDQTIIVKEGNVKIEGRVEASRPIGQLKINTAALPFRQEENCTSRTPCYAGGFLYELKAPEIGVYTSFITITAWDQEGKFKELRFRIFREPANTELEPPLPEPETPETETPESETLAPVITVTAPQNQTTTQHTITLEGRVEDESQIVEILINGRPLDSETPSDTTRGFHPGQLRTQEFHTSVPLVPGSNQIEITARDVFGNTGEKIFHIHRE